MVIALAWFYPDDVADPADLRAFFTGTTPRAALYFRALRAVLLATGSDTAEPALDPSTLRDARELAAAIAGDLEALTYAAVETATERASRPAFTSADAWAAADRVRLVGALVRVVAFEAADADPVLRELLAVADTEIAHGDAERE